MNNFNELYESIMEGYNIKHEYIIKGKLPITKVFELKDGTIKYKLVDAGKTYKSMADFLKAYEKHFKVKPELEKKK
jgi:hypothetical protein